MLMLSDEAVTYGLASSHSTVAALRCWYRRFQSLKAWTRISHLPILHHAFLGMSTEKIISLHFCLLFANPLAQADLPEQRPLNDGNKTRSKHMMGHTPGAVMLVPATRGKS
jgi:hypothetical protein